MSRPAFIVDGFTELKIVQRLCPGSPVQRTDLNGKDVKISAICDKIAGLIRVLNNNYHPIIILVDKENRTINSIKMAETISMDLNSRFANNDIRVGVADRMIENWIIADWSCFCVAGGQARPNNTDGINGSSTIKKIRGTYNKRFDGVELFLKNSPNVMYNSSKSFKYFIDLLQDVGCHFLKFKDN